MMRSIPIMLVLLLGCPVVAGCGSGAKALGAAANVAIGAAVGGVRRAQGGCYTWCDPDHFCNPATGLCERLDCGGKCKADERCDLSGMVPVCVPKEAAPRIIYENAEPPKGPVRLDPPPPVPPPEELP